MKCIKFFVIVTFTNSLKLHKYQEKFKKIVNVQIHHFIKNFEVQAHINLCQREFLTLCSWGNPISKGRGKLDAF